MRKFDTGATRDTDSGKLKYEGFLSPRVLKRFATYMHKHREQADGELRAPDNWQKGIPKDAYVDSLVRHVIDVWYEWREDEKLDQELLCAIMFNTMGLLFESTRK